MEDEFSCLICMDICENAVETKCCHKIFCWRCISQVQICPNCRHAELGYEVAHFARRIIGNMTVDCSVEGCEAKLPRTEIEAHIKNCPNRQMECPAPNCGYRAKQELFAQHLIEAHKYTLVKRAWYLFNDPEPPALQNVPVCHPTDEVTLNVEHLSGRRSERNVTARLGETGKFYCGLRLSTLCTCCDGHCGTTNGCNCLSCMKLDVQRARLPLGWFINRDGHPANRSPQTHHYYCGRKMPGLQFAGCDGFCGPNNGPNCFACQRLDEQAFTRYRGVWW